MKIDRAEFAAFHGLAVNIYLSFFSSLILKAAPAITAINIEYLAPYFRKKTQVEPFVDEEIRNTEKDQAERIKVQAREEVFVIGNAKGRPLDPTARQGFLVGKVGIDATKPLLDYPETVTVPGFAELDLDQYIEGG